MSENNPYLGHYKEDLILKATFDNHEVSLDEFTLIRNGRYGNCYTFNKNNSRKTRRALPGYGRLSISL